MTRPILFLLFLFSFYGSTAQTGKLVVNIHRIRADKGGDLCTAVFTKGNFPKTGRQWTGSTVTVTNETMQVVFNDLPAGTYAIAAFQDIDRNQKLRTNFIGFPVEPFGFSRDAKIRFGPPDFDDAKISVEADHVSTISIHLK